MFGSVAITIAADAFKYFDQEGNFRKFCYFMIYCLLQCTEIISFSYFILSNFVIIFFLEIVENVRLFRIQRLCESSLKFCENKRSFSNEVITHKCCLIVWHCFKNGFKGHTILMESTLKLEYIIHLEDVKTFFIFTIILFLNIFKLNLLQLTFKILESFY